MSIKLQINFLIYLTNKQEKYLKEQNHLNIHKKMELIFNLVLLKSMMIPIMRDK